LSFIDARQIPDGTGLTPDLAIVGGGPAGITLALALANTHIKILLLESGGMDFEPATQALYEGAETGVRYIPLNATRLRYLGGCSNHWGGWSRPLDEIDFEQLDRTFRTNFYAYFWLARAAIRRMKKGSCIINTGSITGLEGEKTLLDYSATKGAIHAFTKSLAQNLVDKGIRVNAVAPGPVWTPLNTQAKPAKEVPKFGADVEIGRPAQPEELAPAYVFLASNIDSSYISGEIIPVLGGQSIAG
jgi:NAD(P)-dependent dehydrogenase (short-subunit alcohol dehydrogenase family)